MLTFHFLVHRIVVQGTPPFRVVHTNAAYGRMTGIHSHETVGKPVAEILSLDESSMENRNDERPAAQGSSGDNIPHDDPAEMSKPAAKYTSLAHLIATNGFGRINTILVHRKLQDQVVGRNVTVINNGSATLTGAVPESGARKRDEESKSTSLTSTCDDGLERQPILRRISIAPIVSANNAVSHNGLVFDREADLAYSNVKRTRHHHAAVAAAAKAPTEQQPQDSQRNKKSLPEVWATAQHQSRAYQPLQTVSHFLIQLQPQGGRTNEGSMESLSSSPSSIEARLLGLSKEQVQRQRNAVDVRVHRPPEMDREMLEEGSISDTTATKELVAVG